MMIYVIPKDDDKPIKIVFEGGKGSGSIVEDDQVYLIDEHPSPEEVGKAFRMLYERLMSIEEVFEKQIPKKPIDKIDFMFNDISIVCPNCENTAIANPFTYSIFKHCPNCGQALDWSDTE